VLTVQGTACLHLPQTGAVKTSTAPFYLRFKMYDFKEQKATANLQLFSAANC